MARQIQSENRICQRLTVLITGPKRQAVKLSNRDSNFVGFSGFNQFLDMINRLVILE